MGEELSWGKMLNLHYIAYSSLHQLLIKFDRTAAAAQDVAMSSSNDIKIYVNITQQFVNHDLT